jgi:hypothetical protein
MELEERIRTFPWSEFRDAYGSCDPETIANLFSALASSERTECESAIFGFWSNICHQGDIYDSTSHALPFLIEIGIANDTLLETDFMELIADLATCAASTAEKTRRKWERRVSASPKSFKLSVDELAQIDFDDVSSLRSAFVENAELALKLVDKFMHRSPEFAAQLRRKLARFRRTKSAG